MPSVTAAGWLFASSSAPALGFARVGWVTSAPGLLFLNL